MTRLQADLALAFAGLIWGFGFVAQKDALAEVGPFVFVAARFLISALVVLPLVLREKSFGKIKTAPTNKKHFTKIFTLCAAFAAAVLLQQYGMTSTNVTHAAFLTGLCVVIVPFIGWLLYQEKLSRRILGASLLSIFGVWLLSSGSTTDFAVHIGQGDGFILLCAVMYALQIAVMGHLAKSTQAPFLLSFLQSLVTAVAALLLAVTFEKIEWHNILAAAQPILYAGLASGGIAYTLQAIAQQHTPASDTAIILSSEALFGGIGGVWLLHEPLTTNIIGGCAAIMAAIALVEIAPLIKNPRRKSRV